MIVGFKNELPSTAKIEKTIEVQQSSIKEGKLEKTETEVVLIKHEDGDVMVGAPKVEKEEMVVVNKKTEGVARGGSGDNLDIATAAGPGAGGPVPEARPIAPPAPVPVVQNVPTSPVPVNPGQIVNQTDASTRTTAITARVIDTSRPFDSENPPFRFSIISGSLLAGHSLVTDFLTPAKRTSGVAGGPYAVNFSNPRIVDSFGLDVSSRYDLTTLAGFLNVFKAPQNVFFGSVGSLAYGQEVNLVAAALGGNLVYEVVSGSASVVNGKLVANSGTGTVKIRAVTLGDGNYLGASAEQTITLTKANQNLNFGVVPARLTGSVASLPVSGVRVGLPNFSIFEADGRAAIDNAGVVSVGKILGADSFTLRVAVAEDNNYFSGQRDVTIGIQRDIAAIEAANPTRRLLSLPDAPDLLALDEFFYFTGKAAGYAGGPDRFFADATVGGTDRTLSTDGGSITIRANQNWDMYAANKFTQDPGSLSFAQAGTRTESIYYATSMELGATFTEWGGLGDPKFDSSSLGFRYLTANAKYLPVFDATLNPVTHEPVGFVDTFGALLSPMENFPVWDDEKTTGNLGPNALLISLSGFSNWTLGTGADGFAARGMDLSANGSNIQILSTGDIHLQASRISGVGSWATTDPVLTLEARGKIKIGAETMTTDPTGQEIPYANRVAPQDVDGEALQVRLESSMPTGAGTTSPGQNIAVIRTGDSLELRNLTIRGFSETTLEKLNPLTKVREGRVLISGSAVRDFKIKELVGAAVNADAKIQMMAIDGAGALAGDMVVEGKMPVQAKIASALAEIGEVLPSGTANAMVDAKQIDLAARNLKFDNANLVAMNSITARANTILVQNSFMTVVRNQGMINMYVRDGLVNPTYGTMMDGRVNFAGGNTFTIGNTSFPIGNQAQLTAAYNNTLLDFTQNGGTPQAGKVNVLKL
ncbi:MAG: hypothetical protein EB090_06370 [Verrucomicrobia bacterium]|nr:hypothetical protein [Verrucomicrobiota bacterium]